MGKFFIFDFDDTLAGFSVYNTWLYRMGWSFPPPLGNLLPGSEEVLDRIKGDRVPLHMLTINIVLNDEMKWRKLHRLEITRWFDERHVHMVRKKTPDVFKRICRGRDPKRCYMVGNSYMHDIRPSLEAGINAIYIPRPHIKRLYDPFIPDHPNLIRLRRISQILEIYDDL